MEEVTLGGRRQESKRRATRRDFKLPSGKLLAKEPRLWVKEGRGRKRRNPNSISANKGQYWL